MNKVYAAVLLTFATANASAQSPTPKISSSSQPKVPITVTLATSSAQAVTNAQAMVVKNPKSADSYAAFGLALCHRAEDASDASLYGQAEDVLNHALRLAPNNFEAKKGQVCVALGRHEFARAHDAAIVLNKSVPDDVMTYGLLVDADIALGNYEEAEKAAQWMLNLRPGNTPALVRAARLREVFGDQEGAIELLRIVLDATAPGDLERRARTLAQIAHLNLQTGNLDAAEGELKQALTLLPNDSSALKTMAQLCLLRGKQAESVSLLRQSFEAASELKTLYELAEAMDAAGMKDEARETFLEFEQKAQAESSSAVNANRQLIFYYADHANKPVQALQIAEQEFKNRHDVHTLDAYAWALHKNGRDAEAKMQLDIALKVGVREASIFYHAGEIELQLGDITQAKHFFRAAAEMHSLQSELATTALAHLPPGRDRAR